MGLNCIQRGLGRSLVVGILTAATAYAEEQATAPQPDQGPSRGRNEEPPQSEHERLAVPAELAAGRAEYRRGYERGRQEAEKELREGRATIYVCGITELGEWVDPKTCLPYYQLGCVVYDDVIGRAEGHNGRIREFIKAHGLPPNSFKRWEKELFDLSGYFKLRSKAEAPLRLVVDGPAVRSPDGTYSIRVRTMGEDEPTQRLVIEANGVASPEIPSLYWFSEQEQVRFLWGPEGSGLAVFRGNLKSGTKVFGALDLRQGQWLRLE